MDSGIRITYRFRSKLSGLLTFPAAALQVKNSLSLVALVVSVFLSAPEVHAGRTGTTTGASRAPVCNVPTDGEPSSIEGISSFNQKMLRFEEFGTHRLDSSIGGKRE